jgi:hypothetical protein
MSADVVVGIEHDHRRSVIARHDGCRESGRSSAYNDNVGNLIKANPAGPYLRRSLCGPSCASADHSAFPEEVSTADNGVLLFPGHVSFRLSQLATRTKTFLPSSE